MATTTSDSQDLVTSSEVVVHGLPVLGWPGTDFYAIHYLALTSLISSIVTSIGVIIYIVIFSKTQFYSRPVGERLVVYLAISDLCFSISHTCDHIYMLAVENHPPDIPCRIMAVFVGAFIVAQNFVVSFISVNSFYMVVMEKKFNLGKYDLRLLIPAFGMPLILCSIFAIVKVFGPSGGWCLVDNRSSHAFGMNTFLAVFLTTAVFANALCYFLVALKLHQAQGSGIAGRTGKYDRLAKLLAVFVVVYILQYTALVITSIWQLNAMPPLWLILATVLCSNFGGVFNFAAYTLMRRRSRRTENATNEASTTQASVVQKNSSSAA